MTAGCAAYLVGFLFTALLAGHAFSCWDYYDQGGWYRSRYLGRGIFFALFSAANLTFASLNYVSTSGERDLVVRHRAAVPVEPAVYRPRVEWR
jgi:hypothetical protein